MGVRGHDGRIWWGRQARRVVVPARGAQPCIDSRVANQITPEPLAPRFPRKRGYPTGIFDKGSARSARRMQLTAGSALRLLESRSPPFEAFRLFSIGGGELRGARSRGRLINYRGELKARDSALHPSGDVAMVDCGRRKRVRTRGSALNRSTFWFCWLLLLHCKSWGWAAAAGRGEQEQTRNCERDISHSFLHGADPKLSRAFLVHLLRK